MVLVIYIIPIKAKSQPFFRAGLFYNIAEKHNIANAIDAPIIKPSLIISNCSLLNSFIVNKISLPTPIQTETKKVRASCAIITP